MKLPDSISPTPHRLQHSPIERPSKRVSLKEMLRWAYGRQQVDVATGTAMDDLAEPFHGHSLDGIHTLMCGRISGHGSIGAWDRWPPHPDAIALHRAVLTLSQDEAKSVIEYGRTGNFPEPYTVLPQPRPKEPNRYVETGSGQTHMKGDRLGWSMIDGERIWYRVDVLEVVYESVPILRAVGRGKYKIDHYETIRHEVEVCPIEWWPDISWWQFVNALHERWETITISLLNKLRQVRFREHLIAELDPAAY